MSDKESTSQDQEQTIEEVFEKLSADLLKELLLGNGMKKGIPSTKKKQVLAIMKMAEEKGASFFLSKVSENKDTMKSALMALEDTDDLGHDSKTKLVKQFKDEYNKLTKDASSDAFFEKFDTSILDMFAKDMEFEEEGNKEQKIDALCEELTIAGLRKMLGTMDKKYLEEVATHLKLPKSGARAKVIDRILGEGYPHLKEGETEKGSKGKKGKKTKEELQADAPDVKKIKKGISFEELYQYYADQLKGYLKDHGRMTGGTKKEMIKRIMAYLEGDDEGTKALSPSERAAKAKKKRRKGTSASTKKKKAAAKKEENKKRKAEDTKGDEASEEKASKKQKTK